LNMVLSVRGFDGPACSSNRLVRFATVLMMKRSDGEIGL
jgi:hypothetical protein